MEKLVRTQTLGDIDEKAMHDFAIPSLILMEHAGIKGLHALRDELPRFDDEDVSLLFIAGSGNNGGDALVMAREAYLMGKRNINILLLGSHISQSSQTHREIITHLTLSTHQVSYVDGSLDAETHSLLDAADIIFDGILGTGLHSKVHDGIAELIHRMNERKEKGATIVSLDVPSGYSDQLPATMAHIEADITITFGLKKFGSFTPAGRRMWGKQLLINPSFPLRLLEESIPDASLATFSDLRLPDLTEDDYKNRRGHVALFGGSEKYTGAVQLTSHAAFRSGAGLVSLYLDSEVADTVRKDDPSFIVNTLSHIPVRGDHLSEYDVIVSGPGWGEGRERQLAEILSASVPVVLDADAIAAFGTLIADNRIETGTLPPVIITPHPGELRSLLEKLNMPLYAQDVGPSSTPEAFLESLMKVAKALNVILVYKSSVTWIADGRGSEGTPIVIDGSNNALGVAGSGDVLTGIIGALLAGGLSVKDAALSGVLLHQKAGALAREDQRWFDSNRLIEFIPAAYETAEKELNR